MADFEDLNMQVLERCGADDLRRMRSLQKFATVHSVVYNRFNLRRPLCSRDNFKLNDAAALAQWGQLGAA